MREIINRRWTPLPLKDISPNTCSSHICEQKQRTSCENSEMCLQFIPESVQRSMLNITLKEWDQAKEKHYKGNGKQWQEFTDKITQHKKYTFENCRQITISVSEELEDK